MYEDYNKHDFKEDLEVGALGEEACLKLFKRFKDIASVIDVRNDDYWRYNDVDFIFVRHNGEQIKVEVKTDTYTTGRMVYELESNSLANPPTPGWTVKTACDWVVYYFSTAHKLYILKMPELRAWVDANKYNFDKVKSFKKKPSTQKRYSNEIIVPNNLYLEMSYLEQEPFCKLYSDI